MKNTINAKEYYTVCNGIDKLNGSKVKIICDGNEILFAVKEIKTREWHEEELNDNEMYHVVEVFTTRKGNQFMYTRDEEINEDYLVRV